MALIFLAIILFSLELFLGSVRIPFDEISGILLTGESQNEGWKLIVLDSRLPRAIAALLCGAFLSVSGLLMQTLFRNPLAGPHILGISAGASLGVALVVMSFHSVVAATAWISGDILIVLSAFVGAFIVLLILFMISLRIKEVLTVLVFGILISAICLAMVGILQYLSPESQLKSFLVWTLGSFDGVDRREAMIMLVLGIPFLLLIIALLKPLNLLLMGEEYAVSLGLNLKRSRLLIMFAAGGLTALITAYCGPIGFIGVVVPHFSRMILKTYDQRQLFLASIFIGINVVLLADLISHVPGSHMILPVNSVTSLIGIPFLFWILLRRKKIISI